MLDSSNEPRRFMKGDLVIWNETDRPCARLIVMITDVIYGESYTCFKGEYISAHLRKFGQVRTTTTNEEQYPTLVTDFNVTCEIRDNMIRVYMGEDLNTKARYRRTNKPRYWQHEFLQRAVEAGRSFAMESEPLRHDFTKLLNRISK